MQKSAIPQDAANGEPPDSNRGVTATPLPETVFYSPKLDYLSYTMMNFGEIEPPIPLGMELLDWVYPRKGYSHAKTLYPAGRVDWHPNNKMQGFGYVFTGEDCATMRSFYRTDDKFIAHMLKGDGRATRCDVAIDIEHSEYSPTDFEFMFRHGLIETPAHGGKLILESGSGNGSTFYIGSRTSQRMLRVYDKAAQMKLLNAALLRVELEAKEGQAQRLAVNIHNNGVQAAGKAAIHEFVKVPNWEWWSDMLNTDVVYEKMPDRERVVSTEEWVYRQVIPSLVKLKKEKPDAFERILAAMIDKGLLGSDAKQFDLF